MKEKWEIMRGPMLIIALIIMMAIVVMHLDTKVTRLEKLCGTYEQVLDVVYRDNPDYYLDVLTEDDVYYELQLQREEYGLR